MPISVTCNHCGKRVTAADEHAGKTAKCPGCKEKIQIPVPGEKPKENALIPVKPKVMPPAELITGNVVASNAPPTGQLVEYKACMFCGESILLQAIKCKHCGEMLNQGYPPAPNPYANPQFIPPPAPVINVPVNVSQQTHVVHQTRVIVQKAPFNHALDFVLTIFTCGGWFPIWIICWLLH